MVDEFKEPGLNDLLNAAGGVGEYYYTAKVWQHSASRSLSYPLRSSIARKLLSRAAIANPVGILLGFNISLYKCLWEEIKCAKEN